MRTQAYKNLTRGNWSLKQGGVVVGHCTELALNNVTAHVNDKSHDRLRAANKREVFAWLEGDLCWVNGFESFKGREVATIDTFPNQAFNRTEKVTFHPFAEVKRGFYWVDSSDRCSSDFEGASCAYFTQSSGVWAR